MPFPFHHLKLTAPLELLVGPTKVWTLVQVDQIRGSWHLVPGIVHLQATPFVHLHPGRFVVLFAQIITCITNQWID